MWSTVLETDISQISSLSNWYKSDFKYTILLDMVQYMDIKEITNNSVNETISFSAAQYHKLPYDILLHFIIGTKSKSLHIQTQ